MIKLLNYSKLLLSFWREELFYIYMSITPLDYIDYTILWRGNVMVLPSYLFFTFREYLLISFIYPSIFPFLSEIISSWLLLGVWGKDTWELWVALVLYAKHSVVLRLITYMHHILLSSLLSICKALYVNVAKIIRTSGTSINELA